MARLVSPWAASFLLRFGEYRSGEQRRPRFLKLAAAARSAIVEVEPCEVLTAAQSGVVLIDVREKNEFQRGHIPAAINLPRGLMELEIERRAPDLLVKIIAYCNGGNRSALAVESLQRMGYANARSLRGGFQAWLDAGLPAWNSRRFIED